MAFFTHEVSGQHYGAWYRHLSDDQLEVIGAGFIRRATYGGFDALSVARSVLENVVQQKNEDGAALHSLTHLDSDAAAPLPGTQVAAGARQLPDQPAPAMAPTSPAALTLAASCNDGTGG